MSAKVDGIAVHETLDGWHVALRFTGSDDWHQVSPTFESEAEAKRGYTVIVQAWHQTVGEA